MRKLYLSVAAAALALAISPVQAVEDVEVSHDASVVQSDVKELHESSEHASKEKVGKAVRSIKKHMEALKKKSENKPSKPIVDEASKLVQEHTTKAEEHLEKSKDAETKEDSNTEAVETHMAEEHAHAATALTAATDLAHTSTSAHKDESKGGEPVVHQDVDAAMSTAEEVSNDVKQEEEEHQKAPKNAAQHKAKIKKIKEKVKNLVSKADETKKSEASAAKASE